MDKEAVERLRVKTPEEAIIERRPWDLSLEPYVSGACVARR